MRIITPYKFIDISFKDPSENDRLLWSITEDHLHPDITEEIAEFVLRKAGDDFCNMIYEQLILVPRLSTMAPI